MPHPYQDHYFHRAKKERYLARAIYKLEQIQKKHRILKPGQRVLDLGAAPGSWIQFTERVVGPKGLVVGVDLQPIAHRFPSHVITYQRDIFDEETEALLRGHGPFDVVLSDMAPKTSGIKAADAARSELLYERALDLACRLLRPGGHFCSKIFQGSDFHALVAETKRRFRRVKVVKPDASRKQSKEIYILAMDYKAMPT
ncbi:23S rRNA Um-2552 2'-O-methyltransferase [Desulfacinum infernum DSM 9756]|uniref:Ribosomal RNA large subunit methyltransferase E n=1 Tax=Desulfacinum infernum DSM 9756 TaxID=1121391 RepID=A0A1M5BE80_9BACT|nr:RlmE family RNA methyltransferase [Desulfacinum infernum]SHF40647.1 23S rRNA Um-2552 2'-O-methyltransferase [Desulfacinum infernum DSM 9756]